MPRTIPCPSCLGGKSVPVVPSDDGRCLLCLDSFEIEDPQPSYSIDIDDNANGAVGRCREVFRSSDLDAARAAFARVGRIDCEDAVPRTARGEWCVTLKADHDESTKCLDVKTITSHEGT